MSEQELLTMQRHDAAELYRPEQIHILLVAQTPPVSKLPDPPRYFYFPIVSKHDWLFRAVVKAILHVEPERNKKELLLKLQNNGLFLIDLKPDPLDSHPFRDFVPSLVERCRKLQPKKIILIKVDVYDAAFGPLRAAGLPVIDERIPFPGLGQQKRFAKAFGRAILSV